MLVQHNTTHGYRGDGTKTGRARVVLGGSGMQQDNERPWKLHGGHCSDETLQAGFNGLRNKVNLRLFFLLEVEVEQGSRRAAGLDCTAKKKAVHGSRTEPRTARPACLAYDEHRPCASQTSRHGHWRFGRFFCFFVLALPTLLFRPRAGIVTTTWVK